MAEVLAALRQTLTTIDDAAADALDQLDGVEDAAGMPLPDPPGPGRSPDQEPRP
jgi:hypothetical protein